MNKKTPIVLVALAAIFLGVGALLTINYDTLARIFPTSQTANVSDFSSKLIFEGSDAQTNRGDISSLDGLAKFTISAWVKSNSARPEGSPAFVSKWDDSNGGQFILYYNSTIKACDLVLWTNSIVETHSGVSTCLEDNGWHHVVGVYDGSVMRMYIDTDGTKGTTPSASGPVKSADTHDLLIGKSGSLGHQFAGSIEDVRIYNDALTPSQIGELFALRGGVIPPVIVVDPPVVEPPVVIPPVIVDPPVVVDPPTSTVTPADRRTVEWTAPIGIPEPSFGIREDVTHYALRSGTCSDPENANKCFNYGRGLEPYRLNSQGEPYTHYIAGVGSGCVGNAENFPAGSEASLGTPSRPLCRLPSVLLAGSIVEVHGFIHFPYFNTNAASVVAQGTQSRPVFIRSTASDKARIGAGVWTIQGTYTIIENLSFQDDDGDMSGGEFGRIDISPPSHHFVVRHNELSGNLTNGGSGVANNTFVGNAVTTATPTNDIVFWDNLVRDGGNYLAGEDNEPGADIGAITASNSHNVWFLDNTCYRIGAGCISSGAANAANISPAIGAARAHHIYIGRNTEWNDRQSGPWMKGGGTVVVSQNKVRATTESRASNGQTGKGIGMGFQYETDNIWYLFNEISDVAGGIYLASSPTKFYMIGNVIRDVSYDVSGGGQAVFGAVDGDAYIIGNTFHNVYRGINLSGGNIYTANNIISTVTGGLSTHRHLDLTPRAGGMAVSQNNIFYQPTGLPRISINGERTLLELNSLPNSSNNTSVNPAFVNAAAGNMNLQATSPARDAGSADLLEQVAVKFQQSFGLDIRRDILGNSRVAGSAPDIGAYEYCTSNCNAPQQPQASVLTVIKSGTGSGSVTGGSINCGPSCTYSGTGQVTLTATPVAGSVFTGWSGGGCSGTAPCTVFLSSSANVVATFAPVSSGPVVTSPGASSITTSGALITWTTNVPSTSQVRFGLTTSYGSLSALITTLLPNHGVPLIRLLPNTTYHYQVISKDANGNTTEGPDRTFTTLANGITILPPSNTSATSAPTVIGATTTAVVTRPPVVVPTPTPVVTVTTNTLITKAFVKGDKGEQVISLQRVLQAQGYIPSISGTFDSTTISALKVFQWKYNLAAPGDKGYGTTDEKTRTKLNALIKALPAPVPVAKTAEVPAVVAPAKTAPTPVATPTITFTSNLSLGMTSPQVKALQEFLNAKGYTVATSGVGSKGNESLYFGPATQKALIKFQLAQKISPPEGFFGPTTRVRVNAMK